MSNDFETTWKSVRPYMNNNTKMTVNPKTGEWKPVEAVSNWDWTESPVSRWDRTDAPRSWTESNIPPPDSSPITGTILFSAAREMPARGLGHETITLREIPIVLNRIPDWLEPLRCSNTDKKYIDLVVNGQYAEVHAAKKTWGFSSIYSSERSDLMNRILKNVVHHGAWRYVCFERMILTIAEQWSTSF